MSVLNKLTEGIVNRDMKKEGQALLSKWEKTGLLEGLTDDTQKNGMARLLENQAKELLREAASSMAGGDVEGFASVAFPIVRRVFGGLIANDLVSVQPMSLPSGLIFFLDFTYGNDKLGNVQGESLYGGGVVGSQITGGVNLASGSNPEKGFYALNNGYAAATGSFQFNDYITIVAHGTASVPRAAAATYGADGTSNSALGTVAAGEYENRTLESLVQFDPDLSGTTVAVGVMSAAGVTALTSGSGVADLNDLVAFAAQRGTGTTADVRGGRLVRRLTRIDPADSSRLLFVMAATGSEGVGGGSAAISASLCLVPNIAAPLEDNFTAASATGGVVGQADWALENVTAIPEIEIKVDSVAVTAQTKKLKAKWTPELGQDLNAYHNLDAEVELTSILSEQIALEIDREILEELIKGATAGTLYWARSPGLFVDRETGAEIGASSAAPDFTGTVSEWYETLLETVNDVSARIHRKTLRGGANFLVTSPEVASILEFTAGFRAAVVVGDDRGTAGAVKVGQLSKKLDVYVDPYFPRNVLLVGRRGGSFLESGFVYAPYVPLQVTPTIFGIEDFVPRKGVMTRYAKKMVRPDMYGLVICRGLVGEAGATS
jgi:hypothetical protein